MSTKKVSYIKILKEAIAEFDTSKNVDVKGPMLDAIVSYKGDGELQTHKDAASILERYYFGENEESSVNIDENVDNEIDEVPGKQDGDVGKEKKQIEDEITNDDSSIKEAAEEDEKEEDEKEEITEQDEKEDEDEKDEEEIEEKYSIENSIIEKLIEEMEEEGDEGEGTKAAGTGTAEKEIPDRKDDADSMVKAAKLESKKAVVEQDEEDEEEVEEAVKVAEQEEKDEEVLDVDKELGDEEVEEAIDATGGQTGHAPPPSLQKKMGGEGEDSSVEEAFKIFKEKIEEADVEEIDSDKVRV